MDTITTSLIELVLQIVITLFSFKEILSFSTNFTQYIKLFPHFIIIDMFQPRTARILEKVSSINADWSLNVQSYTEERKQTEKQEIYTSNATTTITILCQLILQLLYRNKRQ